MHPTPLVPLRARQLHFRILKSNLPADFLVNIYLYTFLKQTLCQCGAEAIRNNIYENRRINISLPIYVFHLNTWCFWKFHSSFESNQKKKYIYNLKSDPKSFYRVLNIVSIIQPTVFSTYYLTVAIYFNR